MPAGELLNGAPVPNSLIVKASSAVGEGLFEGSGQRGYDQIFAYNYGAPNPLVSAIPADATFEFQLVGGFTPTDNDVFNVFNAPQFGDLDRSYYKGWYAPQNMNISSLPAAFGWDFEWKNQSAGEFYGAWLSTGGIIEPPTGPLEPADIFGSSNPGNHDMLVAAASVGPIPNPMHFVIAEVTADDIEIALHVANPAYLDGLMTDLGNEGLLYEATDSVFDAFTFKPLVPAASYELYLWDDMTANWQKDSDFNAGASVALGGVSEFLIWGVDLDDPTILTGSNPYAFLTDLDMSSAGKGPGAVYVTPVPEPSTLVLLGVGLAALLMWRRRRS